MFYGVPPVTAGRVVPCGYGEIMLCGDGEMEVTDLFPLLWKLQSYVVTTRDQEIQQCYAFASFHSYSRDIKIVAVTPLHFW